ncbi:MAG TPA: hypothetical protein VJY35_13495 [Candidatus Eisenbacteria bacterium]|nr:hypothetical protein [Candidatus Eisenbacteria bacterium]
MKSTVRLISIGWLPIVILGSCLAASAATPAAPLTAGERAKLDLARAAVEASRRAGTLFVHAPAEPRAVPLELDPALKLSRLHRWAPATLRADAAAGLSPDYRPIQLLGPPGLNAVEVAKRDGTPLPRTAAPASAKAEEPVQPEGRRP